MNLNMFDDMTGPWLRERENMRMSAPGNTGDNSNDNAGATSRFPANMPLGMAYVPFQQWGEVYSDEDAFCRGTLFPQLDFPFKGDCGDE